MLLNIRRLLVVMLGLLAVLMTACSGPDEHIWLKSPGWSRAVFLGGTAFSDSVPIALDDLGNIYIGLVERDDETEAAYFRIRAFDRNMEVFWDRALTDIQLQLPESLQMLWDDGSLQIFWVEHEKLYMLELDADGNMLNAPVLLSENAVVDSYSVVTDSEGHPVLWFAGSRENPGVYGLATFDGSSSPVEIDPGGVHIQLRYDMDDILYASWLHYPVGYGTSEVIYAFYPSGVEWRPGEYEAVHTLSVGPTSSLVGPALGVDEDNSYLFWTVVIRSGLQAGTVQTEYVHFPHSQPGAASRPGSIAMPSVYDLTHESLSNTRLNAGERVALQTANIPMTTALQEITTNTNAAGELAIAFRSSTQHLWRKERYQVNIAYFQDGSPTSYQPLSYTSTLSTAPNLLSSEDNHLYITWLEKQETDEFTAYLASTSPAVKEALNRSTGREFLRLAAQVSFGMLVGILLAPIGAVLWAMAPVAVLLITTPLRNFGSSRVRTIFTAISVIGAIGAYWVAKLTTLPGMLDYVPFSAWLPEISFVLGNILRWLVPILITGIALVVAWYYTFRQSNQSTLYFLIIYVGIDALFTAAIYGILIYGAI